MFADLAHHAYGCDQAGLIYGYHFTEGASPAPIDSGDALAWLAKLARGEHADGFLWLHFNFAHAACEKWLQQHMSLPEEFFDALTEGSRSTRIEHSDDWLLAVINDVIFAFDIAQSEISTLRVAANARLLVTGRVKPLRSIDKLRASVKRGEAFRSPLALLVHLLRDQADVLERIVRETSRRVDTVEDRLLQQRIESNRADLGSLRRVLVRLQRLLAPEPAALFRLLSRPPVWGHAEDVQEFRQATEEFAVVLNDLSALLERIKLLQEEIAAMVSERTDRTIYTLTVVTVLALPINIVAGFFGMNVGGIPLAEHPHGFWVLVAIVATGTAAAGWWAFRRRPE